MRRREFIGLAGGAAIAWATHGRAQQDVRVRRIGFLSGVADTDPEIQSWAKAFVQGLEELGWVNGATSESTLALVMPMPVQRAYLRWQPS